jgi:glucose-1-phosphate adenylyltransferase
MDYEAMLGFHREHGGDATVACVEVAVEEAKGAFGVAVTNEQLQITGYEEKPEEPFPIPAAPDKTLASMGLYVFPTELLKKVLTQDQHNTASDHDFAKDVLPLLVQNKKVYAYKFGGKKGRVTQDRYWRDVGTIDAYYRANMDLLKPVPPLNLYQPDWPIRTYQPQTPPARIISGNSGNEGVIITSILASGVVISGGNVKHSVLFDGVFIDDKATIERSILFAGVHVGADAELRNCIVDKNVKIPSNEQIGYNLAKDRQRFTVTEQGIVVVPEGFVFG